MMQIQTQNKLREENGKVFWNGKWHQIIMAADLTNSYDSEYKYEYWVAK